MKVGENLDIPLIESDLGEVITDDALTEAFVAMIEEVRASDSSSYVTLKEEISKLEKLDVSNSANRTPLELFTIYESILRTSIELRKILNNFMQGVAQYDAIEYSFYYQGKRYTTDRIKAEWLVASQHSGLLRINLDKAVADLKKENVDSYRESINELFNKHYATYEAAITGTYKGEIGHRGALNYGHIAEAYESHIIKHHKAAHDIVNFLNSTTDTLTVAQKAYIGFASDADSVNYWSAHEGMTAAWQHIRETMGVQRGTVAGDILNIQVKSARKKDASIVRLAKFNTLKTGVQTYCKIISDEPAINVAKQLIGYMGEPVRKMATSIVNGITITDIADSFKHVNEVIDNCRQQKIKVWKI